MDLACFFFNTFKTLKFLTVIFFITVPINNSVLNTSIYQKPINIYVSKRFSNVISEMVFIFYVTNNNLNGFVHNFLFKIKVVNVSFIEHAQQNIQVQFNTYKFYPTV